MLLSNDFAGRVNNLLSREESPSAKVLTGLAPCEGRPGSLGFAGSSGCSDVRGKSGGTIKT